MLAVTRRDGPRRCPAPGKGSHRPHPSARPRARHRLAELPTSPLVARLSGREQRRVRKVGALRMKAMSYRPEQKGRAAGRERVWPYVEILGEGGTLKKKK